jgi:hypothetical protein
MVFRIMAALRDGIQYCQVPSIGMIASTVLEVARMRYLFAAVPKVSGRFCQRYDVERRASDGLKVTRNPLHGSRTREITTLLELSIESKDRLADIH